MGETTYKTLMWVAITLTVLWVAWTVYDGMVTESAPGDRAYLAGDTAFEDGLYDRALEEYESALDQNPEHIHALRGKARTLLQLGRYDEALEAFDRAIEQEPGFGATYANRGILYDRLGEYEQAIADYDRALALNRELGEGPGWLTRFLRNQPEPPPTVADRSAYLKEQLAKPPEERLLRSPEEDQAQRPYKL